MEILMTLSSYHLCVQFYVSPLILPLTYPLKLEESEYGLLPCPKHGEDILC